VHNTNLEASRSPSQNPDASCYWRRCWSQSLQTPFSSAYLCHLYFPHEAHCCCALLPAPSAVCQLTFLRIWKQNDTQISPELTVREALIDEKQFLWTVFKIDADLLYGFMSLWHLPHNVTIFSWFLKPRKVIQSVNRVVTPRKDYRRIWGHTV